jgi:ABC-type Fe3+/spermidine/putrescine transport system ATPase subunit
LDVIEMTASDQDTPLRVSAESAAGGSLEIRGLSHRYGTELALSEINLTIPSGEFLALLGPSGCGKTTLLRALAGFIAPTGGSVNLDGADITKLPPHRRPVNMVFQRPTMFPHLNVFDNVAFGLRLEGNFPKTEITTRVREALTLVRLDGYEKRRAGELSGGQMQRVTLARALVMRPQVLLLDEPLSALDQRIRLDMEVELRRVHRETGATFIYVTHDQREAMALADRVAVFNKGTIEQIGGPVEIYQTPETAFVAKFVGDANVLPVGVRPAAGGFEYAVGGHWRPAKDGHKPLGSQAMLALRPEGVRLSTGSLGAAVEFPSRVDDISYRGSTVEYRVWVEALGTSLKAELPLHRDPRVDVGSQLGRGS